jgi:hypothetical protein
MKKFRLIEKFLFSSFNKDILQKHWYLNGFDGKLKTMQNWCGTDNIEIYKKNGNKKYKTDDIEYHINEYGYRVDPKVDDNNSNIIACFGCSNTFGIGLPLRETWVSTLSNNLNNNYITKNYGVSGASNDTIARLIFNYTLNNKPKIICCYFPEIFRMEFFDRECNLRFLSPTTENTNFNSNSNFYKSYKELSSVENCLFNFIKNFNLIYHICKKNNIKFYWNTWSDIILNLGKDGIELNFDFESFSGSLYDDTDDYKAVPTNYNWKIDSARDGSHFGFIVNEKLANSFYKKIKKDLE